MIQCNLESLFSSFTRNPREIRPDQGQAVVWVWNMPSRLMCLNTRGDRTFRQSIIGGSRSMKGGLEVLEHGSLPVHPLLLDCSVMNWPLAPVTKPSLWQTASLKLYARKKQSRFKLFLIRYLVTALRKELIQSHEDRDQRFKKPNMPSSFCHVTASLSILAAWTDMQYFSFLSKGWWGMKDMALPYSAPCGFHPTRGREHVILLSWNTNKKANKE